MRLIDADELMEHVWRDKLDSRELIAEMINNRPTVKPEIGRWIPDNEDIAWWKCSKCGYIIYSETEKDMKNFHAFCGRCGAKMYLADFKRNKREY